jgi:hypothetical protein
MDKFGMRSTLRHDALPIDVAGKIDRVPVEDVILPRDVPNPFKRRRAARFAQAPRLPLFSASRDDPLRSAQVRRLLGGSLRPPRRDTTFELPHLK